MASYRPRSAAFYASKFIFPIPRVSRGVPSIVVAAKQIGVPENIKALEGFRKSLNSASREAVIKASEYLLEKTLEVTPTSENGSVVNGHLRPPGNLKRAGKTAYQDAG